jgi:uncharacterized protein
MGERTVYIAGSFSWTDLATTDQDAAKAFYMQLFGWEAEDMPAGEGIVYSMMQLAGKYVAAIAPQPEQQRDAGVPPTWQSYITVESADEALARAGELGGTVHAGAFDVFDAGRMGVVQDPQGAYFLVWQPKRHIGAGLVNAPGALTWNELATTDLEAAAQFYGDLFSWSTEPIGEEGMPYLMITRTDSEQNGGMRPVMPPGTPPHWLVYFGTENADASVRRVGELGGSTLVGPIDIAQGRIAVVQDPQGGVFALFQGHFDD